METHNSDMISGLLPPFIIPLRSLPIATPFVGTAANEVLVSVKKDEFFHFYERYLCLICAFAKIEGFLPHRDYY